MAAPNRAKLIGNLNTALNKHYKPVAAPARPLMEHVLYASLLQDAPYDAADEGLAKCEQELFDWNEVRVTTVTELSQVLSGLPDPVKAASRLKGNLQNIFEEFFRFDIDHLKKENLGVAQAKFEKMESMTPFVLSYTVQHGLGGHSVPIDYAAMVVMLSTGIVTQKEAAAGKVPGLERAIPKTKGLEFGSRLHQCGVSLLMDPEDKTARKVLESVSKGASDHFDQWLSDKAAAKKRVKKRLNEERDAEIAARDADADDDKASSGKSKATKPTKPKSGKAASPAKTKTAAKATQTDETPAADSTKKPRSSSPKSKSAESAPSTAKTSGAKSSGGKSSGGKSSGELKRPVASTKASDSPTKKTTTKKTDAAGEGDSAKSPTKKAPAKKAASKKASGTTDAENTSGDSGDKKPAKKSATKAAKASGRKLTKKKPR